MFGLDRFTPQRWDGSLELEAGTLLSLDGVHFEGRDRIEPGGRWLVSNRVTRYADSTTQRGYDPVHTRQFAMIPNGVTAVLDAPEAAQVHVRTHRGEFAFGMDELKFGRPSQFLDRRASAERLPATVDLTAGETYNDYPSLAADSSGSVWICWISYSAERDSVWLAEHDGASWGQPIRVSPAEYRDNFRTAIAIAGSGGIVVVWSGKSPAGHWGLFSRTVVAGSLGAVMPVTSTGENVYHRAAADSEGNVHLVWQGFRNRVAKILHSSWNGAAWSEEVVASGSDTDSWAPDVTADSSGGIWVAWDDYDSGDFNIRVRRRNSDGSWSRPRQVTRSAGFDANASLACDTADRLWIAWDRGEPNWGKDWSSQRFDPGGGAGLYRWRSVGMAVLDGERLLQPPDLMDSIPAAYKDYVQQARLAVDGQGSVWAMARSLTSVTSRVNNNWGAGGIWEMLLTRLDGTGWLPATKLHATTGRNDVWAASTADAAGNLWFAWSRDGRPFGSPRRSVNRATPAAQTTQLSYSVIDPSHPAWTGDGRPLLTEFSEAALTVEAVHSDEERDTAAIRGFRIESGGQSYRILRGDLHRHTDISADGIGEGGLIDFYRYALTAGRYDFMLVADHQFGGENVPGVEYNWWRTEKSEDIFGVSGRFWPLYGTERSLPYPNGHRNTVFAHRGVRWMPILSGERIGTVSTGDVLFPYLRRNGGISTPHTSGTDQGTDWRDQDPELEPVVEIYQSLHASYEYPGAPRAETPDKRYYHHGDPWRPAGFVWNAWAQGIKIGVQASSDHVGTHDSYACVLVPDRGPITRRDILDAIKLRHTYAATDNIILDLQIEDHIMGDAFETAGRPPVRANVVGTGPLDRVVLIKDNEIVYSVRPAERSVSFEYRDAEAARGESYYYVRAEQTDGSLAWSSPIWVRYVR